jgi:lipopolysaccharide/colanic/teichoic acid biosynthesis glycosyltransferase
MRRPFEVFFAAAGLLLAAPLLAVIAIAIKLEDGGPVLYLQPRMGRNFRSFRLFKFRTMIPHADRLGCPLTEPGDPRITRVGRTLRRYKLDELPQLINVITGDLQLVGARPELARYVELFRPQYETILRDRPGITDPASIIFCDEERLMAAGNVEGHYVSQMLPRKLAISIEYARNRSFVSDLRLLLYTAARLFCPSGETALPNF